MKFIPQHNKKLYQVVKKTVLWAVFLCFVNQSHAVITLKGDTLIIDGTPIEIQVVETNENDLDEMADKPDTIPKVRKRIGFEVLLNKGITSNNVSSDQSSIVLNEFTNETKVGGDYSNVRLNAVVYENDKHQIKIGVGYSSWSQEFQNVQSVVRDSIFSFVSPNDGELFQVTRIITELGLEYDTLNMALGKSNIAQNYFDFPVSYKWTFIELKDNVSLSIEGSIIPSVFISSKDSNIPFIEGKNIIIRNTSELDYQQFGLSTECLLKIETDFKESNGVFFQLGYRKKYSSIFDSSNPLSLSSQAFFLGLGLKFYL